MYSRDTQDMLETRAQQLRVSSCFFYLFPRSGEMFKPLTLRKFALLRNQEDIEIVNEVAVGRHGGTVSTTSSAIDTGADARTAAVGAEPTLGDRSVSDLTRRWGHTTRRRGAAAPTLMGK